MNSSPERSAPPERSWRKLTGPLHAETLVLDSPTDSPPLILLHGFTQTRRSWDPFLEALIHRQGLTQPVIRVDLPGHGGSSGVDADLVTTADLVVETCGAGVYCGYSMGGRVALHIAIGHHTAVERLITIGATPGIVDVEERRLRRIDDDERATTIERIGVEAFLEHWLSQPMFAALPHNDADIKERNSNSVSGLASSLRRAGTGTQEPLWSKLAELDMPILLLAGEHDTKFAQIADRMATAIGSTASSRRVDNAGHSAHLENPDRVAEMIHSFCT